MNFTVSIENDIDDESWINYVYNHPDTTIYYHPAHLQVLEEQSGHKLIRLICRDENNQIRGVLPLQNTIGMPFHVGGILGARRLACLPRTPIAGPLADDNNIATELINAAINIVREDPGRFLHIKAYPSDLHGDSLYKFLYKDDYITEIPAYPEEIRFGNSKNHSSIKRAVNKAINNGVEYRLAETENELKQWYKLFLDLNRHHTNPPRPYKLFKILWDILKPKGMMQLALAEQNTNGKKKIIAGAIIYFFKDTVSFAYNGSSRKYFEYRPNDLLHWNTIHNAQKDGYKYYNWGNAGNDNAGLEAYKKKWHPEIIPTYQYFYPNPGDIDFNEEAVPGKSTAIKKIIWQSMPFKMTELLGKFVYRYL